MNKQCIHVHWVYFHFWRIYCTFLSNWPHLSLPIWCLLIFQVKSIQIWNRRVRNVFNHSNFWEVHRKMVHSFQFQIIQWILMNNCLCACRMIGCNPSPESFRCCDSSKNRQLWIQFLNIALIQRTAIASIKYDLLFWFIFDSFPRFRRRFAFISSSDIFRLSLISSSATLSTIFFLPVSYFCIDDSIIWNSPNRMTVSPAAFVSITSQNMRLYSMDWELGIKLLNLSICLNKNEGKNIHSEWNQMKWNPWESFKRCEVKKVPIC